MPFHTLTSVGRTAVPVGRMSPRPRSTAVRDSWRRVLGGSCSPDLRPQTSTPAVHSPQSPPCSSPGPVYIVAAYQDVYGNMKTLQRVRDVGVTALFTLALSTSACTTGPRLAFSGNWIAQLPAGSEILFTAQQTGSTVTGTVANFGPLSTNTSQFTGTVTNDGVTLAFNFPPGPSYPPQDSTVAWTFHGEFSSATTVTGTVVSATGITGQMVITQDNGPIPVDRSHFTPSGASRLAVPGTRNPTPETRVSP